jgi:hypothetical protein
MRVWLVLDEGKDGSAGLGPLYQQVAVQAPEGWQFVQTKPPRPGLPDLRAHAPDLLVLPEDTLREEWAWLEETLALDIGVLLLTSQPQPYQLLARDHVLWFAPPRPSAECLYLALVSAGAGRSRQRHWKDQATRLQQRLEDRILIERAKGVLVKGLQISEEEAYKRLRVLSRRQRRQIRDIAQSVLENQALILPQSNGFGDAAAADPRYPPEKPLPSP